MEEVNNITLYGFKLKIKISENGFPLSAASILLANNINIKKGEIVCDIGTGCGVQAIISAKLGAEKVYASDINPHECKIAQENVRLNGLENSVSVLQGNLLEPFKGLKFDVIVTNIPQTPGPIIKEPIKFIGIYGGDDGTDYISELLKQIPFYLNKGGRFYFQWGSISNPLYVEELLDKHFSYKKIARITSPFGFIELKVMDILLRMKKQNKSFFDTKAGVPHYDKVIYECKFDK